MSEQNEEYARLLDELETRAKRLRRSHRPEPLDALTGSVQYLRWTVSRAAMSLANFHLYVGATTPERSIFPAGKRRESTLGATLKYSSIAMITLGCRDVFDFEKNGMSGRWFSNRGPHELSEVASHWSKIARQPQEKALEALQSLQHAIRRLSNSENFLLRVDSALPMRVGLLKLHANRAAAHMTLDDYGHTIFDVAHVVAAQVLLGEIIRTFDWGGLSANYFDTLDMQACSGAGKLYPTSLNARLFQKTSVVELANEWWGLGTPESRFELLEGLPSRLLWGSPSQFIELDNRAKS